MNALHDLHAPDGWPAVLPRNGCVTPTELGRQMRSTRFVLTPRGYGRSAFMIAEAIQAGAVPIYVYNDLEWLPYLSLWESDRLGLSVHYRNLTATLGPWLRCHGSDDSTHRAETGSMPACALLRAQYKRMRKGVEHYRHLFTFEGTMQAVKDFLATGDRSGPLQCGPSVHPQINSATMWGRDESDLRAGNTSRPAVRSDRCH